MRSITIINGIRADQSITHIDYKTLYNGTISTDPMLNVVFAILFGFLVYESLCIRCVWFYMTRDILVFILDKKI